MAANDFWLGFLTEGYSDRVRRHVTSSNTVKFLRQTRPWAMALGIAGLIVASLLVLIGGLIAMNGIARGAPIFGVIAGLLYAGISVLIYGVPALFALRFSRRIGDFTQIGGASELTAAIEAQTRFWRWIGSIGSIMLSLLVIFIVIGLLVTISSFT